MKHFKLKYFAFWAIISFSIVSCNSTRTALFDQYSYEKTIELKVETINLMKKATTSYVVNEQDIQKLFLEVEKLVEYEKNKPNNEITLEIWKVFNDKDKNLLAGFFKLWKTRESLSEPFIEESQKQIQEAFDLLIQYEIKKDKKSRDNLVNLINSNS